MHQIERKAVVLRGIGCIHPDGQLLRAGELSRQHGGFAQDGDAAKAVTQGGTLIAGRNNVSGTC